MAAQNLKPIAMWGYDVNTKRWAPMPRYRTGPNDSIDVEVVVADNFEGAPVTIGTTAVEITFADTTSGIFIQADHDNSGTIWVGKSTITNAGANAFVRLEPGESVSLELDDSDNAVYAVSDTASQKVYKMAVT